MNAKRPVFRPKIDIFMPLYIGKYLQDTMELDATESGAYLHLLMHEWVSGPLPNDDKRLARIAKMHVDAWSIAKASLMHFFKLGDDGLWRQGFLERLKDEWVGKRLKAHDKAVKAAQARWGKQKAKSGGKTDATSIASAMHEECPISLSTTNPLGDSLRSSPIPPAGATPARPQASHAAPSTKGKQKAKSTQTAQGDREATPDDSYPHPRASASATGKTTAISTPSSNGSHPPKRTSASDQRFTPFRNEVFRWWSGQNAEAGECPWISTDKRALRQFLANAPSIDLAGFQQLLRNRADSEVLPSSPPRKWLADLLEYRDGPLDRFKKPLRGSRVL